MKSKLVKSLLIDAAASRGLTVIPTWRLRDYELSKHLRELFEKLAVRCVVDVGANIGQYGTFLRNEVGFDGTILSFEPGPDAFAGLTRQVEGDPNWHTFQCALGPEEGTVEFNITNEDSFSSFYSPAEHMEPVSQAVIRNNKVVRRIPAKVRTLNDVLPEMKKRFNLDRFYLKLDTQGFDLAVMRGADAVLPLICAMQSEIPMLELYEGAPGCEESLRFYRDRGFDLTGFFSVSRDDFLRIIDIDSVMINRAWLPPRS